MPTPPNIIQLQGGPFNKFFVPDVGLDQINMGLATEWENGSPAIGSDVGYSVYEKADPGSHAFWSHNVWEGKLRAHFKEL